MRLSLSKLRCDGNTWRVLAGIIKELETDEVWVECKDHVLMLYCHHLYGKYDYSLNPTYVMVKVPYLGEDFGPVFAFAHDLLTAEVDKTGIEFNISLQRPKWADRLPTAYKRNRRINFDPEEMRSALAYLMRVPDCTNYPDSAPFNGIMLLQDRMLRTDGNSMHIKLDAPSLSEHRLILSSIAGRALKHALKKLSVVTFQGMYKEGKKDSALGTILFTAMTEEEVEVRIGCSPKVEPADISSALLPITEHSICVTVDAPFLETVCTYVIGQTPYGEIPEAAFSLGKTVLKYEGPGIPHENKFGSIPIKSVFNYHPIVFRLDARLLKQAIQSVGKDAQFTLAPHPRDGFKNYHVNPLYVNSEKSDLLALIAPLGSAEEQDRIKLEREGIPW